MPKVRTEITHTVHVSQEMLDTTHSFAYMRHYSSGIDGVGAVHMAVFHPLGIIDSFLSRDGAWIWDYERDVSPEVPKWDLELLFLAQKAHEAGVDYLVLEAKP